MLQQRELAMFAVADGGCNVLAWSIVLKGDSRVLQSDHLAAGGTGGKDSATEVVGRGRKEKGVAQSRLPALPDGGQAEPLK